MPRTYIKLHFDFLETAELLTMEERGRLVTAMLQFARGDAHEATLTGIERYLFPALRNQLVRDRAAYDAQVRQNAVNGARGGRPRKTEDNRTGFSENEKSQEKEKEKEKEKDEEKEKEKDEEREEGEEKGQARAPTLDQVAEYCREKGLRVRADAFWNYYQAIGWQVGRRPMLDWQAKLREWEARDVSGPSPRAALGPPSRAAPANPALNYVQREYREEDFDDSFYFNPVAFYSGREPG